MIFGIVQTALYVDFAWVYWTRQRVKLRNGGVVDSDDLSRGWLLSRLLGRGSERFNEEEGITTDGTENGTLGKTNGSGGRWGARGISVSADEGVLDVPQPQKKRSPPVDSTVRQDELAGIMEDNDDESSDDEGLPPNVKAKGILNAVGNGQEWRNDRDK